MTAQLERTLETVRQTLEGGKSYRIWLICLAALIVVGLVAYFRQLHVGLITTAMRDQVSWGFYISNFIFLVGVAAAAVLLVVPAYLYDFKPIKEIVLFGEIAAIVAVAMCILFITVDMGQPLRFWHLLPLVGKMNFPASLLIWDVIALTGYLVINLVLVGYALRRYASGQEYRLSMMLPLILISIPWAVSIHTVTAFIFNGLSSRPFWNASILAPRFLASAFCSGPAIMIILFEIMRKYAGLKIEERALSKIAELVAYTIGINLFLLGAEIFKEFYSGSIHLTPLQYLYFGLDGHFRLVPLAWLALVFNILAFVIFLAPDLRRKALTRNIGAVLIIVGVYIEKGMGLVVPGFIPDTLGEIYQYWPSWSEVIITVGIWATGALLYTVMAKFALAALPNAVRAHDR
ncbi:MAG: sulfate reduction electron transfer complex DsrMKJOP subunit DsrP [Thermodesulfobacteriota bacterium]